MRPAMNPGNPSLPFVALVGKRVKVTARAGSYHTGLLEEVVGPRFRLSDVTTYDGTGRVLVTPDQPDQWLLSNRYAVQEV